MFDSAILEVAIGIVFIYLLLSLMCTALREGVEGWLRTRASYLENGIRELLFDSEGTGLAKLLYEHPLVYSLFPGSYASPASGQTAGLFTRGHKLPAYIPSANFAAALIDIIGRGPSPADGAATGDGKEHPNARATHPISIADVRAHIATIGNPSVQRAVLAALDTASGDLEKAKKNLENWYDSAMDRISGRYRRSTQGVLFWLGLFVAVGFNVDTISLADYLYRNETQRGAIVAQAGSIARDAKGQASSYEDVKNQIASLQLPIGWDFLFQQGSKDRASRLAAEQSSDYAPPGGRTLVDDLRPAWDKYHAWLMKPLGWLLTAVAITLGAPFWFDILNKFMVIRSTVKPHEKSREESSEDRQSGAAGMPGAPPATIQIMPPPTSVPTPSAELEPSEDSHDDGCEVEVTDATPDNELPAAQGGVI
ncbi:hypothetical protein [Caballeronia sp. BCC1704]|uniref:hypothetical protein n=1 Tax=Caballeronia sp. BCC1704 TaxID=2676300 RepID=UPI00158A3662|nr:hypothetical protein [Caballeronia sp. BCC1704]